MTKLPEKIEDWNEAPWEKEGAGEFDAERAKQLVFNLTKTAEAEHESRVQVAEQAKAFQAEAEALKVQVSTLEADTSLDDLKRQNAELKKDAETARSQARSTMLASVQTEFGLTERQLTKLDGDDLEALRLDAKETFGEPKRQATEGEAEGEGGGESEAPVGSQPRRLYSPGTQPGGESTGKTRDEVLASIPD